MNRRPMSPGDAVWFHMDGPANMAVITSILITTAPLDFEKVKRVYAHRLARFRRFSERVVEAGLPLPTPHWEAMTGFAIEQQLHHVALPAPEGMQRSPTWSATSPARRWTTRARCGMCTWLTVSATAAR
jgi:hypothetical protein